MNWNEIKATGRSLRRNKPITIINLLGLTIGIAAVITISAFVFSELNRGNEIPDAQNIYRIEMETDFGHAGITPYPLGEYLKEKFAGVESFVNVRPGNFMGSNDINTLETENDKFLVKNVLYADSSYFGVFNHKVIYGDLKNALKTPNGIVLTASESERIFGDINPIGKIVKFNSHNQEVEAVVEDVPQNALNYFQVVANSNLIHDGQRWDYFNFFCYYRLSPGADLGKLSKETANVLNERMGKELDMDFSGKITFVPYNHLYFYKPSVIDHIKHGSFQTSVIFISVSVLILLIAFLNFINLSFAQSMRKAKEIGIRQISGSPRIKIFLLFITEAILMTLTAFMLAILGLWIAMSFLASTYEISGIIENLFSPVFIGVAFIGTLVAGVFAGIFPGLRILRFNSVQILKGNKLNSGQKDWHKLGLTSFQFVIAIVLLVAVITVNKQLNFIQNKNLGFEKENLVYFQFENNMENKGEILYNKLIQNPAIKSFCLADGLPGTSFSRSSAELSYNENKNMVKYMFMRSDYRYIPTMGMQMLQGRNFRENDKNVMIINESAARTFGITTLTPNTTLDNKRIIGIVSDFQVQSLHKATDPTALILEPYTKYGIVRIASSNPATVTQAINDIKTAWNEMAVDVPVEIHFLNQSLDKMYQKEIIFSTILNTLVFLALFISCIGLFGVSLYLINTRIKEVGIRKVNGARVSEILAMLNKDFVKWVVIAFVIATPVSYYAMNKWLENFAYKTTLSWWIFVLAGLLALGIALLTVSWQSWRAATRNPVEALRYE